MPRFTILSVNCLAEFYPNLEKQITKINPPSSTYVGNSEHAVEMLHEHDSGHTEGWLFNETSKGLSLIQLSINEFLSYLLFTYFKTDVEPAISIHKTRISPIQDDSLEKGETNLINT